MFKTKETRDFAKNGKEQKLFLWCVIIFALITILPLFVISLYNHPSADDFAYAVETHMVWKSTRNIFLVIKEAVMTSISYWNRWQGLYTSAFLLALEPGIFGEQYYRITGFLTIGTILIGNLIFCLYVLNKRLGAAKLTATAFGMVITFLMLHWMPSTVEGLYWYNGAMNYTFCYGILLVLFCIVLSLCQEQSKSGLILKCISGIILACALSGGNHVTAFAGLLAVAGILGFCLILKKKNYALRVGIVLLFETAGFLLNILSPGTKVRSNAFEESQGVFWTIWNSVRYLLDRMDGWVGLALIVCMILMLPFIFQCVRRIRKDKKFDFRYPLLVFIASVGFLAAMCCPSYYAMGAIGAGRLVNVIYFAFVLLAFLNTFYVCGWLDEKFDFGEFQWKMPWTLTVLVLSFGMIVGCYGNAAGYIAWNSVSSGEALAYSLEADARYNLYINSEGQDVEVEAFSFYPQLLYYEDITEDAEDWRNQQVREYFELNSVVRK